MIGKSQAARNRQQLNTGFIMESNDAAVGCFGWAIEQHLNDIPTRLKPAFQKILDGIKVRKENLERS